MTKKTLIIIGIILSAISINAAEFAAGDITYKYLGANNYQVTLSYYLDCNGGNPPNTELAHFQCSANSSLNFTSNLTLLIGSGQVITPQHCPSACNNSTSTDYGIREYIYQAIVTLPSCSDWLIYCTDSTRNQISNVTNSNWYLGAKLNNSIAHSNSPSFANTPIFIACIGQYICINQGINYSIGDSISATLSCPKTNSINSCVQYYFPFAYTNFILSSSPTIYNPLSNEICFTPIANETTITGLKVENWRIINGTPMLLGVVYRDIQIKTLACNNQIPLLSGIDTTSNGIFNVNDTLYYSEIRATNASQFSINGFDFDTLNPSSSGNPESFIITWDTAISSANFATYNDSSSSSYAVFNWSPSINDISLTPYNFSATISDLSCPFQGSQVFQYTIKVLPPILNLGNDSTICLNQQLILNADSGNYSYAWSTSDTTQTILLDSSNLSIGNNLIIITRTGYGFIETDSINITLSPCSSLDNEIRTSIKTRIYPNPASGFVNIEFSNRFDSEFEVQIFDIIGRKRYAKSFAYSKNLELDISDLESGMFFIRIIGNGGSVISQKLIIK